MKSKTDKTLIQCCTDGKRHRVTYADGRIVSSGCGDVTEEANRIALMMRLGAWNGATSSCASLAALVLHGCEMILQRPANEDGEVSVAGWRDIYIRFETIGMVERQMKRVRARLRRQRRKAAEAAA